MSQPVNKFARCWQALDIFKLHSRLNRTKFMLLFLFWNVIVFPLMFALGFLSVLLIKFLLPDGVMQQWITIFQFTVGLFFICIILFILINHILLLIRRTHDFNWSAWSALLLLIPLLNFIWLLVLFFRPGTKRNNRFGPPPKSFSKPLQCLAVIMIILGWLISIPVSVLMDVATQHTGS